MQELTKEMNESTLKALGEFLKPEQIKRLHEISYQVRGAKAFSDPELAKKLNITEAQKGDIKTITDESNAEVREIFQSAGDDREAAMKKIAEHRKETLTKIVAKLNDEQQKTWKEMIGAPFEYKPTTSAVQATDRPGFPRRKSAFGCFARDPDSNDPGSFFVIRPSRSWPGCAACRYRAPGGARRGRPELERYHRQERLHQLGCIRNRQEHLGKPRQLAISPRCRR